MLLEINDSLIRTLEDFLFYKEFSIIFLNDTSLISFCFLWSRLLDSLKENKPTKVVLVTMTRNAQAITEKFDKFNYFKKILMSKLP